MTQINDMRFIIITGMPQTGA